MSADYCQPAALTDNVTDVDTVTDIETEVDVDIDTEVEADPGALARIVDALNNWVVTSADQSELLEFLTGPIGRYYIDQALEATSKAADPEATGVDPTQAQGLAILLNYMFSAATTPAQKWQTFASGLLT